MSALPKIPKTVPATELRKNLAEYLERSKTEPVVVSVERGASARVILDASLYNRLVERLEDELDARTLARLIEEDSGEYIPLATLS